MYDVCARWGACVEVDWREQAAGYVTLGMGHCCFSARCAGGSDHMLLTIDHGTPNIAILGVKIFQNNLKFSQTLLRLSLILKIGKIDKKCRFWPKNGVFTFRTRRSVPRLCRKV